MEPVPVAQRKAIPVWTWIWLPFLIGAIFWSAYFFFMPQKELGSSNLPTIHDAQILWLRSGVAVQRGDFVRFTANQRFLGAQYVKRVIGMPGDAIRMVQGQVFINGKALNEEYTVPYWKAQSNFDTCSYLANSDFWTFRAVASGHPCDTASQAPALKDIKLGEGEYFVLGDNRSPGGSEDSRSLGPIHKSAIDRVVVAIDFPPRGLERPEEFTRLP